MTLDKEQGPFFVGEAVGHRIIIPEGVNKARPIPQSSLLPSDAPPETDPKKLLKDESIPETQYGVAYLTESKMGTFVIYNPGYYTVQVTRTGLSADVINRIGEIAPQLGEYVRKANLIPQGDASREPILAEMNPLVMELDSFGVTTFGSQSGHGPLMIDLMATRFRRHSEVPEKS